MLCTMSHAKIFVAGLCIDGRTGLAEIAATLSPVRQASHTLPPSVSIYTHLMLDVMRSRIESLPGELRVEICSHLPHNDLLSLSRTCSLYATAAKPFLFETLTFHGDEEASEQHVQLRHPRDRNNIGPFKPVELASLHASIEEVIGLDIAKYATTFQYSPRVYVEGRFLQKCPLNLSNMQGQTSGIYTARNGISPTRTWTKLC